MLSCSSCSSSHGRRFCFLFLGNIFLNSSSASQLSSDEPSVSSSSSFSCSCFFLSFSFTFAFSASFSLSFCSCWSSPSSFAEGMTNNSFISCNSWNRSASPPLSGCSSNAFFLKAFLIAAWLAQPTSIPKNAQAARFSNVLRRPLACARQSWKASTSSLNSSLLKAFNLRSRPARPPANSSVSRAGSNCPNLVSRSTLSIKPPRAALWGWAS
mmetsp:Transcript_32286/g.106550  ORF Transcript_32286/g.106550 Transcript_32286/m.106550 type:complete len:212 (-) Transcript_32286:276-911(-)